MLTNGHNQLTSLNHMVIIIRMSSLTRVTTKSALSLTTSSLCKVLLAHNGMWIYSYVYIASVTIETALLYSNFIMYKALATVYT